MRKPTQRSSGVAQKERSPLSFALGSYQPIKERTVDISDSVVSEIMKHMPQGAEKYLTPTSGGFVLSVHWKLKNDSDRPNKYSKTVAIAIPLELIEDFPGYPENLQRSALEKIGQHIKERLSNFDPNHNTPRGMLEPVEHWDISIARLFG
jgi:hypothetical protein